MAERCALTLFRAVPWKDAASEVCMLTRCTLNVGGVMCGCEGDQQAIFNAPTNLSASNDAVEVRTFHMKTQAAGQA